MSAVVRSLQLSNKVLTVAVVAALDLVVQPAKLVVFAGEATQEKLIKGSRKLDAYLEKKIRATATQL